jgi:hypothetical protein
MQRAKRIFFLTSRNSHYKKEKLKLKYEAYENKKVSLDYFI